MIVGPVATGVLVAACSVPRAAPTASGTVSGTATELPAAAVAYLRAWAANDVATMVRNSRPGSPARGYAAYWGRVFAAGRQDVGEADLIVGRRSATLDYGSASYRIAELQAGPEGLATWRSYPGGPLAPRVVTGPDVGARIGGLTVTAHQQYRNSAGGLRITLTVGRSPGTPGRDVAVPSYREPGGRRGSASVGAQGATGVIPVPVGRIAALVAASRARPGGALLVRVYRSDGSIAGRRWLSLPR